MSGTERRLRSAGFASTAACVALAIVLQRTLLAKAKAGLLADPDVRAKAVRVGDALKALAASMGAVETLALAAFAAIVLVAVVAQVRTRAVSRFLDDAFGSRLRTGLLVALLSILPQVWLFDTGPLIRHDGHAQTGVVALVAENLRAGEPISYSFRWYGGYPLVAAYGCGFHVLAALATIALGSLEWGVKVVLLAAGVVTALATLRLVLRLGCRPSVAVVAALAPLLSFQHTHTIAWGGKFPEAVLYALFPLLLTEALDLPTRPLRALAGFSLVGGAMAVVHLPLGGLGCVVAAGFSFAAAFGAERPRPIVRTGLLLAAAAALVLAIAAPIAFGVAEQRDWIVLGRDGLHTGGVARFAPPDTSVLSDLLVWRHGWTGDVHAYLGLTLVIGGIAGVVFAMRRGRSGATPLLFAMALSILMLGGGYLASRASGFLVTLLAGGLALGIEAMYASREDEGKSPLPLAAIAAALLLVDLGPTTIQAPGAANAAESRAHLEQMASQAQGGRSLRLTRRGDAVGLDDTDNAMDVALDVPLGSHHYMAPNVWCAFTLALLNEARASWGKDDERCAAALRGLAFQGVTVIGEDSRTGFGAPQSLPKRLATSPGEGCVRLVAGSTVTFGDAVELGDASVAEALESAFFSNYDKEWRSADTPVRAAARAALARMRLDPDDPEAARLLVVDSQAAVAALSSQKRCRGEVLSTQTSAASWRVRVRIDDPGAVRLAVAGSPRNVVTVDGVAIAPAADVTGGLVLALATGEHLVEVRATPAAASRLWIASGLLAAVLAWLRFRRRD